MQKLCPFTKFQRDFANKVEIHICKFSQQLDDILPGKLIFFYFFDKYGDPKIEDDDDDDAIPYKSRRSRTTLPKGVRPFKRRNQGVMGLNYARGKEGKIDCEKMIAS